jgi:hypothetical protein
MAILKMMQNRNAQNAMFNVVHVQLTKIIVLLAQQIGMVHLYVVATLDFSYWITSV